MRRLLGILPLLLLFLFGAVPSFADSLQVTFSATIDLFPTSESVSGSFLWNTQTEVLSNISLTSSSGPFTFLPDVQAVEFAGQNFAKNYPPGSLIFLDFMDPTHTINFQNQLRRPRLFRSAPFPRFWRPLRSAI